MAIIVAQHGNTPPRAKLGPRAKLRFDSTQRSISAMIGAYLMASSMKRIFPLFLACVLTSGVAVAEGKRPSLSEDLSGEAKAEFEAGKVSYGDGDFAGASRKFRRAFEIAGDARLLWNMAAAEKGQRHYAKARALIERFLKSDSSTPGDRKQATEFLAATTSLVGQLSITCDVDGAQVSIDGEAQGITPIEAPLAVDLGTHSVRVTKSAYTEFSQEKTVDKSDSYSMQVSLVLAPKDGKLVVSAGTSDVITVDGSALAKGHFEGPLEAGSHVVRVTHDGMTPYESHVDIVAGERRSLSVSLSAQKSGVPAWLWIVGGSLVVAGGATAGYFLFRPSDKGPPAAVRGTLPPNCIAIDSTCP